MELKFPFYENGNQVGSFNQEHSFFSNNDPIDFDDMMVGSPPAFVQFGMDTNALDRFVNFLLIFLALVIFLTMDFWKDQSA